MVRVSIVIPCYNGARVLPDALQSVLDQTWTDYEAIVVDDGSTDATPEVARAWCERYPERFRCIRQENQGVCVARNTAIAQARGELLAMLDCDDLWLPERLAEGIRILDAHPEAGLAHANIIRIDDQKRPIRTPTREAALLSGWIFDHLYARREHIACATVLVRRECLERVGGFDPQMSRWGGEDRELWLRVARQFEIAYIPRELACYRVSPGGMSRDMDNMLRGQLYALEKNRGRSWRSWLLWREGVAVVYLERAHLCQADGRWEEARRWYQRGLRTCPFRRRTVGPAIKGLLRRASASDSGRAQ